MLQPMNRPNFFPGQLVDYRDFNKLSQQADKTVSLLCQYLFKGGGIVVDALGEFKIEPTAGLGIRIQSGIALLPNGQAVCLSEDQLVDLAPYRLSGSEDPLVVSLVDSVLGADRYTDEADPSITGFRTELIVPQLKFSTGQPPDSGIELFRIAMKETSQSIRSALDNEGWNGTLMSNKTGEAVIDLRFRPRIVPQTFVPFSTQNFIDLRSAIYTIEAALRKISKLYLVDDTLHSLEYLTHAHAELLSRPFQPSKVSFLVSEFADRLARYLELLSRKLGGKQHRFDEKSLFEVVKVLEPLRIREIVPRTPELMPLVGVATHLQTFIDYALENYHLVTALEEALLEIRRERHEFGNRLLLAGHAFERVDLITQANSDKFTLATPSSHVRSVTTRFHDGAQENLKGVFFKKGVLTLELQIPHPNRLACVVMHQYVRRAGSATVYEINGKRLEAEKIEIGDDANSWINRGLVIPSEHLVQGSNLFRIQIEHADLDFGFFDCMVYQPRKEELSV